MFALTWRCDGSEGVKWYLRAIRPDGSFHGEVRFQSPDPCRCLGTFVSGRLSPAECERMAALTAVIRRQPPPVVPGPHFAALFEKSSPTDWGAQRLFEYQWGDEARSEPARAFVDLAGLVERHLSPFYPKIA